MINEVITISSLLFSLVTIHYIGLILDEHCKSVRNGNDRPLVFLARVWMILFLILCVYLCYIWLMRFNGLETTTKILEWIY